MTDEQMRIKIAEACGWKALEYEDFSKYGVPCFMLMGSNNTGTRLAPPDYLNDLNAMHEAEKTLLKMDGCQAHWETYSNILTMKVGCEDIFHATARQRAEAFIKTKGILP